MITKSVCPNYKFALALGLAIAVVETGCLPGMHGGPPGLPGLPRPPGLGLASPPGRSIMDATVLRPTCNPPSLLILSQQVSKTTNDEGGPNE